MIPRPGLKNKIIENFKIEIIEFKFLNRIRENSIEKRFIINSE